MINAIANPQMPEIGERFLGTVVKTTTFGAFVSLLPGKDGLLHISEVRKLVGGKRIDAVEDVLAVGQKVQVELRRSTRAAAVAGRRPARGAEAAAGESADDAGDDAGSDDNGAEVASTAKVASAVRATVAVAVAVVVVTAPTPRVPHGRLTRARKPAARHTQSVCRAAGLWESSPCPGPVSLEQWSP